MHKLFSIILLLLLFCPLACDMGDIFDLRQIQISQLQYGAQYKELARYCQTQAQNGDVRAMTILGVMYLKGSGLHADFRKGFMWLKQAADQNDPAAMHYLSTLYLEGQGTVQDLHLADHWNEKAILGGNLDAMVLRGVCYLEGLLGAVNEEQAIAWFERAAAAGSVDGMLWLAREYEENINYEPEKAVYWLERAAALNSEYAMFTLAELYRASDPLAAVKWYEKLVNGEYSTFAWLNLGHIYQDMGKPEQAIASYEKAAMAGESLAMLELGNLYSTTNNYDRQKAVYWLERVGSTGKSEDMVRQAMLYLDDTFLPVDEIKAIEWLEKAAQAGHTDCLLTLAELYTMRQQDGKALAVYRQSAELGYVMAMTRLAKVSGREDACYWYEQAVLRGDLSAVEQLKQRQCANSAVQLPDMFKAARDIEPGALGVYFYELGRPQDYVQAALWLQRAQLSSQAMYCLGMMYEKGLGVPENTVNAYYYLEQAARNGYAPARRYMLQTFGF